MLVAEWDHFMCFTCRELGTIRDPFQPAATALVRMKYSHGKTDPGNLGMLFAWLLASAPSSISILALLMGVSIHAAQRSYLQRAHKEKDKCHVARLWNWPRHPSTGKWIKKMWCVCTMEIFSAKWMQVDAAGHYNFKQINLVLERQIPRFPHSGGFYIIQTHETTYESRHETLGE